MTLRRRTLVRLALLGGAAASVPAAARAAPRELRVDWALYNPVSLVLRQQGLLEREFAKDGIGIRWIESAGSNKALELLRAGALDFGSTAGAAALIGRVNGNPVKAIYVYSRPEWVALVTRADTPIRTVADLKGKSVAATRGTDAHIFLVRALAGAGLSERDIRLVLLQHADGRLALMRGDVDAWAGLDPMMASAEIEQGARIFYRNPAANSWGVLDTTETFAADHPNIVARVLAGYETARLWSLAHPDELRQTLVTATKLPGPVIARQLERTDLSYSAIGDAQRQTILEAGLALQQAGVFKPDVDVRANVDALIDERFNLARR